MLKSLAYLVALFIAHTLLSAHYFHACRGTFLAGLVGHGSTYCAALDKSLRAIEAAPLVLAAVAHRPVLNDG